MKVFGELKSAQLELWGSDPASSAQTGRVGFNTTTLRPKIANGTLWKDLAFSGGTATNDNHLVLAKAATGTLTALTREQGSIFYDTSTNTVKYDDGSGLIELATANGVFSFNDGSVTAPSLKFTNDTQTGLYLISAGNLGFTVQGIQRLRLTTAGAVVTGTLAVSSTLTASSDVAVTGIVSVGNGSDLLPSMTFGSDLNTGFYRANADIIGVVCGATRVGFFYKDGTDYGLAMRGGNTTDVSYGFDNDLDTGMYQFAGNEIGFSAGGVRQMEMRQSYVRTMVPHRFADGSTSNPSIGFENDSDTGIYREGGNQLGFAAGGAGVGYISASGLSVGSLLSADQIKWKVFSGTSASGSIIQLTVPSGQILGVVGVYRLTDGGGDSYWFPIANTGGGISAIIWAIANTPNVNNSIGIDPGAAGIPYRVVIYYQ